MMKFIFVQEEMEYLSLGVALGLSVGLASGILVGLLYKQKSDITFLAKECQTFVRYFIV